MSDARLSQLLFFDLNNHQPVSSPFLAFGYPTVEPHSEMIPAIQNLTGDPYGETCVLRCFSF